MEQRSPWIVYANFVSDLALGLEADAVLERWATQAPRKVWLLQAGDVLVSPVPVGRAFTSYALDLLGVPGDSVSVVHVPSRGGTAMAEALRHAGLMGPLRALLADRDGAALLPTALDASSVALAAELGVPVAPYTEVGAAAAALDVTSRLNTKTGFRQVAGELGIRLPRGCACPRSRLDEVVPRRLAASGRAVLKPDRSAGGHGMRFVSPSDAWWSGIDQEGLGGAEGLWVVEEWLDVAHSVSIQMEVGPQGVRPVFNGEMRTVDGVFAGYVSPLAGERADAAAELEQWGASLGDHLASGGYAGPFSIDAVITRDGTLLATESNIRRTATTTPQVMVDRLARSAGLDEPPVWLLDNGRTVLAYDFETAASRVGAAGVGWNRDTGEGVVLYADAPGDGRSWRYGIIGARHDRVLELEARLADVMDFG
ncbi:peptide ligase PGM1-related protein [Streptomyces sp. SP18CS02]|uniref:preATP grasp domain-containing protein n=1 Tax=Streptomyces sp. SP18CS02 TaxID=3002531 RepID=UPI002E76498D|nr:peptide ligase PGM1-related protein [Streptomyces sp. SP18CS02]MEE1754567.1 peptide ligase PGM1-related protein [Streptomyces sp. SP18CS02]